jgi:hypothetical protein
VFELRIVYVICFLIPQFSSSSGLAILQIGKFAALNIWYLRWWFKKY